MTIEHTPWSYDADDNEIRSEADGSVLFDIHNASGTQADLAASAPDLLAALEAMRNVIQHSHECNRATMDGRSGCTPDCERGEVLAAIKLARGE